MEENTTPKEVVSGENKPKKKLSIWGKVAIGLAIVASIGFFCLCIFLFAAERFIGSITGDELKESINLVALERTAGGTEMENKEGDKKSGSYTDLTEEDLIKSTVGYPNTYVKGKSKPCRTYEDAVKVVEEYAAIQKKVTVLERTPDMDFPLDCVIEGTEFYLIPSLFKEKNEISQKVYYVSKDYGNLYSIHNVDSSVETYSDVKFKNLMSITHGLNILEGEWIRNKNEEFKKNFLEKYDRSK